MPDFTPFVRPGEARPEAGGSTSATALTLSGAIKVTASRKEGALTATYVPRWKANTAYLAGDKVLSPNGDVVSAKTGFTSGSTYKAANWDLSATVAGKLDTATAATTYVNKISLRDQQIVASRNSIALRHWRLALGGWATAPADVWFGPGDSITAGYTVSKSTDQWGYKLIDGLWQRFPVTGVTGGFGYLSARNLTNSSGNHSDNPVAFVGGSQAGAPAFGLDLQARVLSASGNTITWTFTGTGFDIDYTKYSGGGSFSWAVDGGSATTVATANATLDTGGGIVQIRGLVAASHTVTIAWVSGSSYINGGFAYNGDETKGIRGSILATLGWSTGNWWPTNSAQRYWAASIPKRSPDLVFLALGANDFGSATPVAVATYKANLKAMIAAIKAGVTGYIPSFVLLPYWSISSGYSPLAPYNDYVTAQYEVAAEDPDNAVAIFVFQQRINTGAPSTADGFLPDTTHPINEGNQAMADMLLGFLTTA